MGDGPKQIEAARLPADLLPLDLRVGQRCLTGGRLRARLISARI
jgi:hypothetical protein